MILLLIPIVNLSIIIFVFRGDDLELKIFAPFYDDPAPDGEPGVAFFKLWEYEVQILYFG